MLDEVELIDEINTTEIWNSKEKYIYGHGSTYKKTYIINLSLTRTINGKIMSLIMSNRNNGYA